MTTRMNVFFDEAYAVRQRVVSFAISMGDSFLESHMSAFAMRRLSSIGVNQNWEFPSTGIPE